MKNKNWLYIVIVVFIIGGSYFVFSSLGKEGVNKESENVVAQPHFQSIPPAEFYKQTTAGDGVVIDLRTPEEVATGKITDDALEIDFYNSNFKSELDALDKERPYLIYCRSGARSGKTLALMQQLGFTNVTELAGGVSAWQLTGRPLVTRSIKNESETGDMIAPDLLPGEMLPIGGEEDLNSSTDESSSITEAVDCSMDARQCPDGSYVGRIAPDCSFAPCP